MLLTRAGRFSTLKRWALGVAQRRGMRRAKVALARKLATVLHRSTALPLTGRRQRVPLRQGGDSGVIV
jgi:hypothetical protein